MNQRNSMSLPKWLVAENELNTFRNVLSLLENDTDLAEILEAPTVLIDRGFIDVNGIPNKGADFIDPWGNPYNFVVRDGAIEVFTFGQDGKSTSNGKDLDDINSWDEIAPWREFYPPPSGANEIVVLVPLVVFILIIGVLISFRFLRR